MLLGVRTRGGPRPIGVLRNGEKQSVTISIAGFGGKPWLAMLESMKMEILLPSPCDGVERELSLQPGSPVRAGPYAMVIDEVP